MRYISLNDKTEFNDNRLLHVADFEDDNVVAYSINGHTTYSYNDEIILEDLDDVNIYKYLTFTPVSTSGYISFSKSTSLAFSPVLQYSRDNGKTWQNYTIGTPLYIENQGSISFMGNNLYLNDPTTYETKHLSFSCVGQWHASGNILSLLYGDADNFNIDSLEPLPAGAFFSLFSSNSNLLSAPALPSKILSEDCYCEMFKGCSKLTKAPKLCATTLARFCYQEMFSGCSQLNNIDIEINGDVIPQKACYNMFYQCSSLTNVPVIHPTSLTGGRSCEGMFEGCTSLTTAPDIHFTSISGGTACARMFYGCTSLIIAPELPALTLANGCYDYMFLNCSNLNYIKAMFTTTPSYAYCDDWVKGVASTGTFVKNSAATWNVTGDDGIPTGWTVQTASN